MLVVSAYDPTVWDLRAVPKRRIRAVIATGYSAQGVAGLDRSTPVRFAVRGGGSACGQGLHAYEGGANLERLAADIDQRLGRGVDAFSGGYNPTALHMDRPSGHGGVFASTDATARPLRPGDILSSAPIQVDDVPPREAGLALLMRTGAIRPAGPSDIAALNAALTRASPTGHLAPVVARGLHDAYVVERAITVPKGMYGAHSATFLLAPGVPQPIDPGSHNSYYQMDNGACRGTVCRSGG